MKNILFINISKKNCHIAIYYKSKIIECKKYSYKNHLNKILKIINNLIKNNNINIKKINFIVFVNDPDFVTSTNIGFSISKGLSIGLKIPIITISLFELISEMIFKKLKIKKNIIISIKNYSNIFFWSNSYKDNLNNWIIKRNMSNINGIINFLKEQNGNWIINILNINNIYNKKFYNIKLKYINFNYLKIKNVIDLILNKLN